MWALVNLAGAQAFAQASLGAPLITPWSEALLAGGVDVHPEYPRPQLVRPDWQNLNGEPLLRLPYCTFDDVDVPHDAEARALLRPGGNFLAAYCRRLGPGQYCGLGLHDAVAPTDDAPAAASDSIDSDPAASDPANAPTQEAP